MRMESADEAAALGGGKSMEQSGRKRSAKLTAVFLLALAMALTAGMGAAAYAETVYDVWVGGTRVTSINMNDVLRDGKVSYTPAVADDPATTDVDESVPAILTLDGAAITGGYAFDENNSVAAIYADDDLTIDVTGTSIVIGPELETQYRHSYGVYIDGEGSNGKLTVTGPGTLTAAGGATPTGSSFGVYANGAAAVNGTLK